MPQDAYQTLGVSRSASAEDIKRAFHKLAHKYHPDKAGGDAEQFKKISAAYAQIKDKPAGPDYEQGDIVRNPYRRQQGFYDEGANFNTEFINKIYEQILRNQAEQQARERASRANKYASFTTWQDYANEQEAQNKEHRQRAADEAAAQAPDPNRTPWEQALDAKRQKEAQENWYKKFGR